MNRQQRRSYGTGSLLVHKGAAGKETWYGRWYVGEKRLKRRIGPKRKPGSSKGLTRPQAEAELRRLMVSEQPPPAGTEVPLGIAAEHMLRHLRAIGRKPTTLESYRSILRTHIAPQLADIPISQVTPQEVDALIESMLRNGKGAKTRANALKLLSQTFTFAQRKGWCRENPCELIDRPRSEPNTDIRSLRLDELVSLLKAIDVSQRPFGWTDRVLFMTAAMTGLRQGELLALRWRDVDWNAHKIRVRRNYVRGHWGTPKSRRGSRAVPLAPSLATELQAHLKRSRFQGYDDLVFGHPETGEVLVHATVGQHFKKALEPQASGKCASTTFATPTEPRWPRLACRCEPFRSGWAIATSRRPSSMPTTNRGKTRARWSMTRSHNRRFERCFVSPCSEVQRCRMQTEH